MIFTANEVCDRCADLFKQCNMFSYVADMWVIESGKEVKYVMAGCRW